MIGQTILHYKIIEKLGEGGMGVVYKAEDTKLRREVAIKFLPHHILANTEERQRFEIEAQASAALNHSNIATIYAIEETDNEVFIAMEYIEGKELKNIIETNGDIPLPLDDVINYIEQIAKGLLAAHQKGIIHRDIKSSNIMITKSGQMKIMDFGLAKVGGTSHITKYGTTLGTTAYMSPEQARGEHVDHRTDIWSLGVISFELLTGRLPYLGEFEQAIIYAILNEEPRPIMNFRKDIPLKLDQIIMKMLAKNRELRYQSVAQLLKDLGELKIADKSAETAEEKKTVAVLPFENISPDKEADYFAEGLSEELITNLAKIKEINLIARSNSMRYKNTEKDIRTIGRELSARYIMQGTVRKFKDDLRISVQLTDVSKEFQLWGETYKGKLADIFDIQEKVSKEIIDALRVSLSLNEKVVLEKRATVNAEAFDLYLRARDFMYRLSKNNIQFAIQLFKKAIESDVRYAKAYAGLGEAYTYLYIYFERNPDILEKAIESGLKALTYDPSLSEAYATLALAHYNKGSIDEALISGQKAVELDPNNYIGLWVLGRIYHSTDRDEEAVKLFNRVISLNSEFYSAFNDLLMCYERLGYEEETHKILHESLEFYPKYLSHHPDDARAHIFYATVLSQAGDSERAKIEGRKAFELSPDDSVMLYNVACLYSRLDEKISAIDYLGKAIATGYSNFEWIKRDSDFDNIRNESKYIELLKGK